MKHVLVALVVGSFLAACEKPTCASPAPPTPVSHAPSVKEVKDIWGVIDDRCLVHFKDDEMGTIYGERCFPNYKYRVWYHDDINAPEWENRR